MSEADARPRNLLALSIQQPWAELILRGVKTIEVRRTPARPQGPVYLYASQRRATMAGLDALLERLGISAAALPQGALVGTVDILDCRRAREADAAAALVPSAMLAETYSWMLGDARRLPQPLPPRYVPFGTWFYPFQRNEQTSRHRRTHGGS